MSGESAKLLGQGWSSTAGEKPVADAIGNFVKRRSTARHSHMRHESASSVDPIMRPQVSIAIHPGTAAAMAYF